MHVIQSIETADFLPERQSVENLKWFEPHHILNLRMKIEISFNCSACYFNEQFSFTFNVHLSFQKWPLLHRPCLSSNLKLIKL
jgi:hypothetical protein